MGLFQTGSTLKFGAGTIDQVGHVELLYTCDDCERRTGDPYFNLAGVVLTCAGDVVDDSSVQGWTFFYDEAGGPCTRAYCGDCSKRRTALDAFASTVVADAAEKP